jgi:hypothetical protein
VWDILSDLLSSFLFFLISNRACLTWARCFSRTIKYVAIAQAMEDVAHAKGTVMARIADALYAVFSRDMLLRLHFSKGDQNKASWV